MSLRVAITGQTAHEGGITIFADVLGTEQVTAAAQLLGLRMTERLAGALYRQGEVIMAESKEEVPVDTGALRSSGHVQPPVVTGTHVLVALGYGGAAIAYALRQHEELDYHHTVGNAKYLENPFRRHLPTLDRDVADDMLREAV